MIGKKKLSEIKTKLAAYLNRLPGKSPKAWLAKEIESAREDPARDPESLEMLLAVVNGKAKKRRKTSKAVR
jgi:hypothetical protein